MTMVAAPFQDVDEGGQPPLAAAAPTRSNDVGTADAVDGMLAAVVADDAGILSFSDTSTSAERRLLLLLLPSDRRDEGGSLVAAGVDGGGGSSWDHGWVAFGVLVITSGTGLREMCWNCGVVSKKHRWSFEENPGDFCARSAKP